jgi:hypothetical protein
VEKVGTSLKQEIEVDVENLPPSVSLKLVIDGKEVATFLTSSVKGCVMPALTRWRAR